MPKRTEPPRSAYGLRLFGTDTCDYCLRDGEVTYWEVRPAPDARAKKVRLCVECMLSACESVTQFGFVNQWRQWENMRSKTRVKPLPARKDI